MAKFLCAMKSALGIRTTQKSNYWKWVWYHTL